MSNAFDALSAHLDNDAGFLASALREFAGSEGLDHAGLAARLGCAPETLPRLGVCYRPRPDRFLADIEVIAARFEVDGDVLLEIVRRADGLRALRTRKTVDGLLAAARDRDTP